MAGPAIPAPPASTTTRTSSDRWPPTSFPPWIHRVFANLKTRALGVYHGLSEKHLQSYLDEFTFRFNRRRTPYAAFRYLLGIAVARMPHNL